MLPVIHLFNINLYPYGMMMGIGIVIAVNFFIKKCKNIGYDEDSAFNMAVISCIAGIIGSKLFYIITELSSFIKNPLEIVKDFGNGFVLYGAVIGGVFAAYLYTKSKRWSFLKLFDIAAPLIAMAQGFGRIGCLFAGCCYGRETSAFWGIEFENSPYAPSGVKLIPTQIISSIGDFIIFLILLWFDKNRKKNDGQTASLYLILYSLGRFSVEFLRGDPRGTVLNVLSTSQFISIFIFIAGVILYNVTKKIASANYETVSETPTEVSETIDLKNDKEN